VVGKWITIQLVQKDRLVTMILDGKEKRDWALDVYPAMERPSPAWIGRAVNWPPHKGRIRNLRLENFKEVP
jgi:hypothetical protein